MPEWRFRIIPNRWYVLARNQQTNVPRGNMPKLRMQVLRKTARWVLLIFHVAAETNNVRDVSHRCINPFRTAVSFWGQLGEKYLEFEWIVPQNGTGVLKGLSHSSLQRRIQQHALHYIRVHAWYVRVYSSAYTSKRAKHYYGGP